MSYANRTLRSLPFGRIISGPMIAAIQAQGLAAKSTVNFIKEVGFKRASDDAAANEAADEQGNMGDVRNVTFKYKRKSADGIGDNVDDGTGEEEVSLTVPILTIVPIPYIRIEEMTIQFTANITEQQEYRSSKATSNSVATDTNLNFKAGGFLSPVKFSMNAKVATRHNSSSTSSSRVNNSTQYTVDINVRAVQDEMPAGLAKVLHIMEQAILEKPAVTP
ncbi:DUF2589 domain-containing protein [Algoriphagus sp. CAU 1675]|uniref:DUF2589 domain-containing protein n=1 Tax=Algoriphagus sp. CAU 1675 TaxID=3032597 RepID=UPI0023DAB7EF|nr:DUF2589 domain-containing protein [Algoriphagus sp. CAU 1675]MDF2156878.1 DUF2589 domain-containing protein [Algoriphagus sp. CAU 1675]